MQGLVRHLDLIGAAEGLDIDIHNINPPPLPGTLPLPPLDPHAPAYPPPGAEPVLPPSLSL